MARGISRVIPKARIRVLPLADGGEGTLDVLRLKPGRLLRREVRGPMGSAVRAPLLILRDGTALIEMAKAAGLTLIPERSRNPLRASTYGVGQLMAAARDAGCRKLVVALGGSSTVDGGAGMAQALGARLLDSRGEPIPAGGGGLGRLAFMDLAPLQERLGRMEVLGVTDVSNPLLGSRGAARVFGPQKGASPSMVRELERGLANFARVCVRETGLDPRPLPGAGAAGGLGAGLIVFASARLVPGATWVLRQLSFPAELKKADLVVTGEGHLDQQTGMGKLVGTVAAMARRARVPAVAFAGRVSLSDRQIRRLGLRAAYPLADSRAALRDSMRRARILLRRRASEVFRGGYISPAGRRGPGRAGPPGHPGRRDCARRPG